MRLVRACWLSWLTALAAAAAAGPVSSYLSTHLDSGPRARGAARPWQRSSSRPLRCSVDRSGRGSSLRNPVMMSHERRDAQHRKQMTSQPRPRAKLIIRATAGVKDGIPIGCQYRRGVPSMVVPYARLQRAAAEMSKSTFPPSQQISPGSWHERPDVPQVLKITAREE